MWGWVWKLVRDHIADDLLQAIIAGTGLASVVTYVVVNLADYNIPINWPLLSVSGLALLIASVTWVIKLRKKPAWMKYTDDSFEGVNWRWQYSKEREVINLTARCPRCTAELDLHECLSRHGVRYFCTKCVTDRWASITATQPKYVDEFVLQLIDGKLYDIKRGAIHVPGFPGS